MQDYPELSTAWEEMQEQNTLYRPSTFWENSSALIVKEIRTTGIENFRSCNSALDYFVPTYGSPGNSFTAEEQQEFLDYVRKSMSGTPKQVLTFEKFMRGELLALADYRVLLAADDTRVLPWLHHFTESNCGKPVEQFCFDGRLFSRSSLNYLLGLAMLKKELKGDVPHTVLEIGGGFGTLGEILSSSGIENLRYIDIDIPPTSYIAQFYLTQLLGETNVASFYKTRNSDVIEIGQLPRASVLCSWQIEKLRGEIDLFVNFISFQEMEPHIVENYLDKVKRLKAKWILLRNIREGKQKKTDDETVGVEIPITTENYIDMLSDYELISKNVLPYGYLTVDNFHSELLLLRLH